jgi:N-acetylmuramic acid 6-phosphate etherase
MSPREIVRLMNEEEFVVIRAMQQAEEPIAQAIELAAEAYRMGGRIVYVGSGTSGRVATMDAAEMPPTFGIESDRFVALMSGGEGAQSSAREDAEDDEHSAVEAINALKLGRSDLVIGITASGKTPFALAAIRHAARLGVPTIGIANNKGAPLLKEADLAIVIDTGPEILTGSTRLKAGTAQKLVLNQISTGAMVLAGKVVENLMVDVRATNSKLKDRCIRIVRELTSATADEAQAALEAADWRVRDAVDQIRSAATAP